MRTLQILFGGFAAVALLGASVAVAEIRHESIRAMPFSVSTEDGFITLPDVSFCSIDTMGGEEAQEGCMMIPGGPAPNLLMELPVVLPPAAQTERYTSAQAAIAPVSSLQSSAPYNEPRPRRGTGTSTAMTTIPTVPPPDDPPPIVVIPEPATLVIMGLGVGGAVVARRWREKTID